jgi:hypothetical protein
MVQGPQGVWSLNHRPPRTFSPAVFHLGMIQNQGTAHACGVHGTARVSASLLVLLLSPIKVCNHDWKLRYQPAGHRKKSNQPTRTGQGLDDSAP